MHIVRRKIVITSFVVAAIAVISAVVAIAYFIGSTTVQGPPINRDDKNVTMTLAVAGHPSNTPNPIFIDQGPVNMTYTITNNRESAFRYGSFTSELQVYDMFGRLVWDLVTIHDVGASSQSIPPGSQGELSIRWSKQSMLGRDFGGVSIQAPPGPYTVRVQFLGGGVSLSDAKIIMIK
jgi:hypothetical protein